MIPAELKDWFRRVHPGWNWDNRCAGAAYQVCVATGRAVRTYDPATAARLASVIESTDPTKAPPGAFHFWDYWATIKGVYQNYGHVGVEMTGGGWALMSNPEAAEADWGTSLGVTNVAAWTARRKGIVTYLGWSHTYGANTATITTNAPAGGGSTPFVPEVPSVPHVFEEDTMTHSISVNGNQYAVGEEFISHYADTTQAEVTRQVTSATDELHTLTLAQFQGLLDGLGIPRTVLNDKGLVLNPQNGKFETGGVWSRRREAVAKLDRLLAK